MCISNEQINDVIEAMNGGEPMKPLQIISNCDVIEKTAELWEVLQEMKRRNYVLFVGMGKITLNEKLGVCDSCGTVDHHLLTGLCESCRERSTWVNDKHQPDTQILGGNCA